MKRSVTLLAASLLSLFFMLAPVPGMAMVISLVPEKKPREEQFHRHVEP